MDTQMLLERIHENRVLAIARYFEPEHVRPMVQSLVDGGITVVEFTVTNDYAVEAIRLTLEMGLEDVVIGAGSIIDDVMFDQVVAAGAQFIVTPVLKPELIKRAVSQEIPIFSGAFTPTEIQTAYEAGASAVKVFPADHLGPKYIKNVLAPLPHLKLVPTGGINVDNVADYFKAGVWAVGAGSSLLDPKIMARGEWSHITFLARKFAAAAKGEPFGHQL